jgi:hypothetical protein
MAVGLYHLSEWLQHHDLHKLKQKYPTDKLETNAEIWKVVEREVEGAGYIRDLANAAKHVVLRQRFKPSTGMHHAANVSISVSGFDSSGYDQTPFDRETKVTMDDGTSSVDLEPIAKNLFDFWAKLIDELYPPTSP